MASTLQDIASTPASTPAPQTSTGRVSARKKQAILSAEMTQYSAVLQHAVFEQDPASTVATHLSNSIQLQRNTN